MRKKLCFIPVVVVLSGCLGSTGETISQNLLSDDSSAPFTDVYIEYPGPQEKWAGPQSFSVHLSTKVVGKARVDISTSIFKSENQSGNALRPITYGLTPEAAREQIARLNIALKAEDTQIRGCLLPVKVRLVRSDGVIVSRTGCRGQTGWPRVASEIVSHLIESALASPDEGQPHSVPSGMPSKAPGVLPSSTPAPAPTVHPTPTQIPTPTVTPASTHAATPAPALIPAPTVTPAHSETVSKPASESHSTTGHH